MIINSAVQYVSIGSVYALFSVTMRAVLPHDDNTNSFAPANALENIFLICLVLTIILSSIIRIEWSHKFYWLISIIFGILTVITVVITFILASENTSQTIGGI